MEEFSVELVVFLNPSEMRQLFEFGNFAKFSFFDRFFGFTCKLVPNFHVYFADLLTPILHGLIQFLRILHPSLGNLLQGFQCSEWISISALLVHLGNHTSKEFLHFFLIDPLCLRIHRTAPIMNCFAGMIHFHTLDLLESAEFFVAGNQILSPPSTSMTLPVM